MKKVFAVLLALVMVLSFTACEKKKDPDKVDPNAKSEGVMTHAEFIAAEDGADVVIEGFITAKIYAKDYGNCNLMLQDGDGAYYVYRMACTDEDNEKLVIGQKIKVSGVRTAWQGENEIKEATGSYELADAKYTFEAKDITGLLGADNLIDSQNMKVKVAGASVKTAALYKWDGSGEKGDDLYLEITVDGKDYIFVVESDLCGQDTEVYKAVEGLTAGQSIDIEGYLYWYNGPQLWMEKVTVK